MHQKGLSISVFSFFTCLKKHHKVKLEFSRSVPYRSVPRPALPRRVAQCSAAPCRAMTHNKRLVFQAYF